MTMKKVAQVDDTDLKYKRGQVYKGTVTSTTPTAVYVDLGDGDQGVVPGRELELMTRKMLESLTEGAEVDVYVVNPKQPSRARLSSRLIMRWKNSIGDKPKNTLNPKMCTKHKSVDITKVA